jgi:hypothetical protein
MRRGDGEEALEEFLRLGAAAHGEEIDQLDEKACAAAAGAADGLDQAR